jgi:hypothetical protein
MSFYTTLREGGYPHPLSHMGGGVGPSPVRTAERDTPCHDHKRRDYPPCLASVREPGRPA